MDTTLKPTITVEQCCTESPGERSWVFTRWYFEFISIQRPQNNTRHRKINLNLNQISTYPNIWTSSNLTIILHKQRAAADRTFISFKTSSFKNISSLTSSGLRSAYPGHVKRCASLSKNPHRLHFVPFHLPGKLDFVGNILYLAMKTLLASSKLSSAKYLLALPSKLNPDNRTISISYKGPPPRWRLFC